MTQQSKRSPNPNTCAIILQVLQALVRSALHASPRSLLCLGPWPHIAHFAMSAANKPKPLCSCDSFGFVKRRFFSTCSRAANWG